MVPDLLAPLDEWIARRRPDYYVRLQPGPTDAAIADFVSRFGLALPGAFRALYRWRNGQDAACSASLQDNWMFSSLEEIAETKALLDDIIGSDFEGPCWWRRDWVPFLANGGGDHLCLDLAADDGGQPGQLRVFWHDWEERSLKYASVEHWLGALVTSLENGTFEVV